MTVRIEESWRDGGVRKKLSQRKSMMVRKTKRVRKRYRFRQIKIFKKMETTGEGERVAVLWQSAWL